MYSPFMHGPDFFGPAALLGIGIFSALIIAAAVWSFFWKGMGLWHAARNGQTVWFIVILLVNTLGILEIVYLVWFRADRDQTPVFPFKKSKTTDLPVAESSPAD